MNLWIVFKNEFFQGDLMSRSCLGVFSSDDTANEHVLELEDDVIFDPMLRTSYEIVPVLLDQPLEEDPE